MQGSVRERWRGGLQGIHAKTIPLNIAVIGNSGVDKSSFINTIRGLTADDEGAAEVDAVECTSEIESYPHPNNELLKLWDLPGVGTDTFPKHTYLEAIHVDCYEFFLLISATRFTENDTCVEILCYLYKL